METFHRTYGDLNQKLCQPFYRMAENLVRGHRLRRVLSRLSLVTKAPAVFDDLFASAEALANSPKFYYATTVD